LKRADVKQYLKMKRTAGFFAVISILMFGLSSCDKGEGEEEGFDPVEIDMTAFNDAKTNWAGLNIRDYTFEFNGGGRVEPYKIVVRNGAIQEIAMITGDAREITLESADVSEFLRYFNGRNLTIDDLFLEIERLSTDPYISVSGTDWTCFDAVISYDATYGYPKNVKLSFGDYGKDDDGEYFDVAPDVIVTVTRFEAE